MPSAKNNKLVYIFIGIVLILGYLWYRNYRYQYFISTPVDATSTTNVSFIIKNKQPINDIAANLLEKNLILDEGSFKSFIKHGNYDRKIIAGRFILNRSLTIPQIVEKITDSRESEFVLTIPEGSTINDIDQKLVDLSLIKPGDFITANKAFNNYNKYPFLDQKKVENLDLPLEGYLFPDTYFINPSDFSSENLISVMLNNFAKKALPALNADLKRDNYDKLIMASIIEKEIRTDKDLPIVAGILWKRLDQNWQLGADSTLLYLKSERTISAKDLAEDSPYNTRKKTGLPPGPISNPGLKSIIATVTPKESTYYYYLTKPGSGEVVYAATNDEQNANKAKYLQ